MTAKLGVTLALFVLTFIVPSLIWHLSMVSGILKDMKPTKESVINETWLIDKYESQCLDYNSRQVSRLKQALNYTAVNRRTGDCHNYQETFRRLIYPENPNMTFPDAREPATKLAFSFVVHNMVGLFEVLLHLTFRPYNAYCIYVGNNSRPEIIESISNLVQCYQTMFPESKIFMVSHAKPVKWGQYSLLEADLTCMELLLDLKDHPWNYVINLAGTELPLYSVDELSQRLNKHRIKHSTLSYYERKFDHRYKFSWGKAMKNGKMQFTKLDIKKKPPPFGLQVFKGFKNVILRRDFVQFVVHHPVAKTYQEFLKDTFIPDEHYYATLSRIEKADVIYVNNVKTWNVTQSTKVKKIQMPRGYCSRISLWRFDNCHGEIIRQICHLAKLDLKEVKRRNQMKDGRQDCFIANKFDVDIDPTAITCLTRKVHGQERQRMSQKITQKSKAVLNRNGR